MQATSWNGALREEPRRMTPQKILVPTDFSQGSEQALDYACALAKRLGATIHLVHGLDAALPELTVTLRPEMLHQLFEDTRIALERVAADRRTVVEVGSVLVKEGDQVRAIGPADSFRSFTNVRTLAHAIMSGLFAGQRAKSAGV